MQTRGRTCKQPHAEDRGASVNFKTNKIISQEFLERFSEKIDYSLLDLDSLRKEQMNLVKKVILEDNFDAPEILAGVDLSYEESNFLA